MKAQRLGYAYRVNVSCDDVEKFAASWPCSGLRYNNRFAFTFDARNGDLVGVECFNTWNKEIEPSHVDEGALLALSKDAQLYAHMRLKGVL